MGLDERRKHWEAETVSAIADALHKGWQKTRVPEGGADKDGERSPRWKMLDSSANADDAVPMNGKVDIANTPVYNLPPYWQKEQEIPAANVFKMLMTKTDGGKNLGALDTLNLDPSDLKNEDGILIHWEWRKRNEDANTTLESARESYALLEDWKRKLDLDHLRYGAEVFKNALRRMPR